MKLKLVQKTCSDISLYIFLVVTLGRTYIQLGFSSADSFLNRGHHLVRNVIVSRACFRGIRYDTMGIAATCTSKQA